MLHRLVALVWVLPLVSAAQRASTPSEFDVRSENRRYVAQVRHVEVGKPDPARPRYELTVYAERSDGALGKQWTMPYTKRASNGTCLLTDDGSTFVRVTDSTKPDGPIVEVIVKGLPRAKVGVDELEIQAGEKEESWLATDTQFLRFRPAGELNANACLDLLGRDGFVRTVDLSTGESHVVVERGETSISPAPPEDAPVSSSRACIDRWSAPTLVLSDEPFTVQVHGNFPTPGWVLVGFSLKAPGAGALVLTPCIVPPPSKTIAAQVVVGFDSGATIEGLAPGSYTLSVANCERENSETRALEVLPADLLASLKISVGEVIERSLALSWDARATLTERGREPRTFLAPADAIVPLARALHAIEPTRENARDAAPSAAAGARRYELTWADRAVGSERSTLHRVVRDDASIDPKLHDAIQAVLAVEPPPKVQRFAIDVHQSTIAARTSSSGLLKALGHDHKLMVQRLSGEVFVPAGDPAQGRLFVEVDAGSLAVVDNDSQDDRAAIEKEMNSSVLESSRYPRITFRSNAIEARRTAENVYELTVHGDLALHGLSREIEIPVQLELSGDRLRARGTLELRQSDYKIRPTSAAGGTIKVGDGVTLEFEVFAAPE